MNSCADTHRWVGCPIRIPTDQRLLAAPHGFSQRATSFIASWCQGIHRMPFSCSPYRRQSSVIRLNQTPDVKRQTSDKAATAQLDRRLYSLSTSHNAPEPCRHRPRDDPWSGLHPTTIPSGQTITGHRDGHISGQAPDPAYASPKPPEVSCAPRSAPEPDSPKQRTQQSSNSGPSSPETF